MICIGDMDLAFSLFNLIIVIHSNNYISHFANRRLAALLAVSFY